MSASRTTEGRGKLFDSVLDTIGNTPCIRINNLAPDHVRLYVKAEFFNPMASVKDRLAISIIEEAERSGALKPGQTVIEATSGNTGIGLAMVCAAKGYPLVVTMAALQNGEVDGQFDQMLTSYRKRSQAGTEALHAVAA
jgi:cysteine synthase A